MGIFEELKRRNVFRVGVAFAIVAWLIAQIADLVFDSIGAPDWVMPALLLVLGLGFLAAVIIAWAYEITPEGIKREHDVIRDDSITHVTAKKLDYITIAAAMAVAVMFGLQLSDNDRLPAATDSSDSETTVVSGDRSIAVLPFANRSNQDEDLFFTDGIHDDLLTQLAKISDLKVISRTSVMQYRDTEMRVPDIAAELGVSAILEGGVQRAGQRIRINAQLIDVATDEHLWAETFDREMTIDNLFDIQSEITRHIVTAVRGELTTDEQSVLISAPTQSIEAFEAYLRAKNILGSTSYNFEKYQNAQPYAEQAIALDPGFALAHLMLAEINAYAYWMGYDTSSNRKLAAKTSIDLAASLLDPNSPEILAAQGEYAYRFEQDYETAERKLIKAHEGSPGDADILVGLGASQRRLGRWEKALESLKQSRELDPANPDAVGFYAGTLYMMKEWARLKEEFRPAMDRFGDDAAISALHAMLPVSSSGNVAMARGRLEKIRPSAELNYFTANTELPWFERDFAGVVSAWEQTESIEFARQSGFLGIREMSLAMAFLHIGEDDEADRMLSEAVENLSHFDGQGRNIQAGYNLITLATVYSLQGENEMAIAAAEQAAQLVSLENDKVEGTYPLRTLAWVLARSGERDRALELIAKLIDLPAGFVRWEMYLDPRWDFMRDDERFNELIRPHDLEQ
jgi:TolB-like protein/Tfp pilus assembly protein PilF